ncbi:MAG: ABC transporter substrate-binding protein [Deltaproteobacteria bacterium]|nr:ABC transporter substrate-binding protein [Deltaproteobacteria bacterium]
MIYNYKKQTALFTVSLILAVVGLIFFAANQTPAEKVKRGGILRYGLSSEPPNLDPQKSTGTAAQVVKSAVYSGLLRYWKGYKIDPDLAKSWDISSDGKTYTFHLHENVYWHNGDKFSAEDVKFSLERIMDPKAGSSLKAELTQMIQKIEVVDDNTVKITLKATSPDFLHVLSVAYCKIVSKKFIESGGNPNKTLMGTGPFKFKEYTPTVSIKVVRNENYFKKGRPYLDGIDFIFYPDQTTRVTALRTGAVDIIGYLPWKQMSAIERDRKLKVLSDKEMLFMDVQINVKRSPLDNPKVRKALAWAIDRQAVVNSVFFGRGRVIGGIAFPPSWNGYSPELAKTYTYDPEKAKKLLAEAGYPNGFKMSVLSTFQYGMHKVTGEIVQANFKDIGIDCDLELVDWATDIKRQNASEFDVQVMGTMPGYKSGAFLTRFFRTGGVYANACQFSDKKIDELLDKAAFEMDPKKRAQLFIEVQKRALELNPIIFICWREQAEGAAVYVKGYEHIPGIYDSSNTFDVTWLDK